MWTVRSRNDLPYPIFNCIDCIIDGFVVGGGGKGAHCKCTGKDFMTIFEGEEIDLLFMLQTPPPKHPLLMNAYTTNDCNDINITNV